MIVRKPFTSDMLPSAYNKWVEKKKIEKEVNMMLNKCDIIDIVDGKVVVKDTKLNLKIKPIVISLDTGKINGK